MTVTVMAAAGEAALRDSDLDDVALDRVLTKTWATPGGLLGWFKTVDHKVIGKRYLVTAFIFRSLGGASDRLMGGGVARGGWGRED